MCCCRSRREPRRPESVLHSHDGIYLWGKEKVVAVEQEHPYLAKFKQERYGGKSIASELARRGYVTMAIDMSTGVSGACCCPPTRRRIASGRSR